MEPAARDRIQRMIDAEAAERFPPDARPRLALLQHGDHPVIEPGERYLGVTLGEGGPGRDAWMEEHGDRLEDFRARRLPEIKGFVVTTEAAGYRLAGVMKLDGLSLLDPDEDERAGGFARVAVRRPADLATLDALITAGIAASRTEAVHWALARVREQPAHPTPGERARKPDGPPPQPGLVAGGQWQAKLAEYLTEHFPDAGVQRVALLRHGDDPSVEPGDLLVRVFIKEAEQDPPLRAWTRDQETMISELRRQLAENVPGANFLEFWFGEDGRQGALRQLLGSPPVDAAGRRQDLPPADVRVGPPDLETLDTLITAGTASSRAEAIGWVLARIRERPAYARLSDRARELDELKARF